MIEEISTTQTSAERKLVGREIDLLRELYGKIWMEAFYDFDTRDTQAYAQKLYPLIKELKELIGFPK